MRAIILLMTIRWTDCKIMARLLSLYCSDAEGPANPNGAARDIAGILSNNGRVMGMMPHPERAISQLHGSTDGATLLAKSLEALM